MKQKRKVKSLIPLNHGSNLLLTALLFLSGGVLVFGAITLFTSSVGVASAQGEGDFLYDNGIEDEKEVLLNLFFAPDGGADTVNEMHLTDKSFYMEGDAGVMLNESMTIDGYINYLGGDSDGVNVASNNITVIGGKSVKVFQRNDNATVLGGLDNKISQRNTLGSVAPVVLGGAQNEIGTNQVGDAIVGGQGNIIGDNVSYGYILGGEDNNIGNNGGNVIVGGKKVHVAAGLSNLFAFSDENGLFNPEGGRAFYLEVANGLGLNRAANNGGVESQGSVSFGTVNIEAQSCGSADVGVQGTWQGCLVGCTQTGANHGGRREMIDHSDICEGYCNGTDRCRVNPIEPTKPDDYTSYCTTGGVNTAHSVQCAENSLGVYENVIFETYLIDSEDNCSNYSGDQNKCVFICEHGYHLTGQSAGSTAGMRCYQDCEIPWNGNKIKHNDTIEAYNIDKVSCSNHAYIFPKSTAIINVPQSDAYSRTWDNISNMYKAATGDTDNGTTNQKGHSYESCTNFDHKKTLVCKDGTLYIAKSDGKTPTTTPARGAAGSDYRFGSCTLTGFTCSTIEGYYNLTQAFLNANDQNIRWKEYDRSVTNSNRTQGDRGIYELCVDWTADSAVNGSSCSRGNPSTTYHYKLVKCQTDYSTGTTDTDVSPYKCMKGCKLKNRGGTNVWYPHNTTLTGYKAPTKTCSAVCPGGSCVDVCEPAAITCNDGNWVMGTSKNGTTPNTEYGYNDCYLNEQTCSSYKVSQDDWNGHNEHGTYDDCDVYSSSDNKFICKYNKTQYKLTSCDNYTSPNGYHTENNKWCIPNKKTNTCSNSSKPANSEWNVKNYNYYEWEGSAYNNGSWVHKDGDYCDWKCSTNYHLEGNRCVDNTQIVKCTTKPEHSTWDNQYQVWQWYGTWNSGEMRLDEDCSWTCDPKYDGDDCGTYVPDGCSSSVCGSKSDGETCTSYAVCSSTAITSTCNDGSWDTTPGSYGSPNQGCSGCYSAACGSVSNGGTCTSYERCSPTAITSTCNNGSWSTTPGPYSSENQGCYASCSGCPSGTVSHGGTCTSYDKCSTTAITSTCNNGSWSTTPGDYSSPSQDCDNNTCYSSACGTVDHGESCTTYAKCSSTAVTSTCNNGSWSTPPKSYSSPNQSCNSCSGCPSGNVSHGGTCTSYDKCSTTAITSRCNNGSWSTTPGAYGSASQDCGETSCYSAACGTKTNGQTCTTYDRCSTTPVTSTCNNGSWNTPPLAYSSRNQGCYSCTEGCPSGTVSHGSSCTSYNKCSTTAITSTCTDGSWNKTPGAYGSASQDCNSCTTGCPSGSVSHGGTCTSYAVCSTTAITSTCNNGSWSTTPGAYGSASQGCSCQGSYPSGATPSTKSPTNNTTSWFCSTSTTQACSYTCPSGYKCNSSNNGCRELENGECDTTKYTCKKGEVKNEGNNGTQYTWNCKGADDTGNGPSCTAPYEDPCSDYPLTSCPQQHATCQSCTSNGTTKYKIVSCSPSVSQCFQGTADYCKLSGCPANSTCDSCTPYEKNYLGTDCEQMGTSVIYKVTGCADGYTLDSQGCLCVTCASAAVGWTLGTPNTRDCYNYQTKTICGQQYYKKGQYKCTSDQTCHDGECEDQTGCPAGEVDVTYAQTQMYQPTFGDWDCGSYAGSRNGYCCGGGTYHGKDTSGCTSRNTSEGVICAYRDS